MLILTHGKRADVKTLYRDVTGVGILVRHDKDYTVSFSTVKTFWHVFLTSDTTAIFAVCFLRVLGKIK
jgi:hypothetical protein